MVQQLITGFLLTTSQRNPQSKWILRKWKCQLCLYFQFYHTALFLPIPSHFALLMSYSVCFPLPVCDFSWFPCLNCPLPLFLLAFIFLSFRFLSSLFLMLLLSTVLHFSAFPHRSLPFFHSNLKLKGDIYFQFVLVVFNILVSSSPKTARIEYFIYLQGKQHQINSFL